MGEPLRKLEMDGGDFERNKEDTFIGSRLGLVNKTPLGPGGPAGFFCAGRFWMGPKLSS
jgi:hypothetical protein